MDIPGLNYRVHLYHEAYKNFRKGLFVQKPLQRLALEDFKFLSFRKNEQYPDFQSSFMI
jgi:beta-galactosidase